MATVRRKLQGEFRRVRSAERKCRVCGCTDERACPGGCSWVEEDLCSKCAKNMKKKFRGGGNQAAIGPHKPGDEVRILAPEPPIMEIFRSMQGLEVTEIIRRTAAAAGTKEYAVGKMVKEKAEELRIVTDVFAAFLVAAELGVMKKIAEVS